MAHQARATAVLAAVLFASGPPALAAGEPQGPGEPMIREFLKEETRELAGRSLAGIESREAWEARRPQLERELRESLGLDPPPPRGDLRAEVTGVLERGELGIAVEKLHFQSVPGLYVTANLYRPLKVEGKLPAVLYLCGHGPVKIDGVPCGAKTHYQHHPTWFARHGFVCLVIDTLQFGEIEGFHHGTYRLGMWWWVSRGYTPAGVEAWNSIRALDYLEGRPEVDPKRIGVTGRSGGGIGTWWLAALDSRPLVLVPVAGITDLENHVVTGCIEGHCDCNFTVNLHRWDYPALAALAAPRHLLLANSDQDRIFPLDGVMRIHARLKALYGLLGAQDRLGLLITDGPHADTPELQVGAFRWLRRWLSPGTEGPISVPAEKPFDPRDLRAFTSIPAEALNTRIHESFVEAAPAPPVPRDAAEFEALRAALLAKLREKTFRAAPDAAGPTEAAPVFSAERNGLLLRGFLFRSERQVRLPFWVVQGSGAAEPARVVLRVAGEEAWRDWLAALASDFAPELGVEPGLADPARAEALRGLLRRERAAVALVAPRGIGPTRLSTVPPPLPEKEAARVNHLKRRFLAVGRTLEETQVHDVRRAVRALAAQEGLGRVPLWLEAEGEMAAVALYAGTFEPQVKGFDLHALPASHQDGVPLLNVLRVLDLPQAAALPFPRPVRLHGVPEEAFRWTQKAAQAMATAERPAAALLSIIPAGGPAGGR